MKRRPLPTIAALDPARGEDFHAWAASSAGHEVLSRVLAAPAAPTPAADAGAAAKPGAPRRRPLRLRPGLAVAALALVLLISFSLVPGVFFNLTPEPPGSGPGTSGPVVDSASHFPLKRISVLLLSAGVAAPQSTPAGGEPFPSVDALLREIEALSARIEAGSLEGTSGPADAALALAILADLRTALEGEDISVILAGDITPEERTTLRQTIGSFPEVRASAYVTAEEAWVRVKEELSPEVVAGIDQNPLPASIEVAVLSTQSVAPMAARLEGLPGVERVVYGQGLAQGVIQAVEANLLLPTGQ